MYNAVMTKCLGLLLENILLEGVDHWWTEPLNYILA